MSQLQVQVFMNEDALRNQKRAFERIVNLDDSIQVDYNGLIKQLRFLYGSNVIINFNVKSV